MIRLTALLCLYIFSCAKPVEEIPATKNYSPQHTKALTYCKQKGFSQEYYFLVDLSVHSGRNRFFVYDFMQKKVSAQNLVTHGSCDVFDNNPEKYSIAKFDNREDSHCSSLGKYKIGKRDYSSWGINVKYWLEGLEATNNNARSRVVVLHSWEAVANSEIYPKHSPLSWGCPAVSDTFMRMLDTKLQATGKPVLLWIVN